jgi:hypothetical protein
MSSDEMLLEYLFCCRYTANNNVLDLLEDLANRRQKCPLNNKLESYGDDYHSLYKDVLKYFKIRDERRQTTIEIKTWSSIKKKTTKDFILKNFIIEVKIMYNFDDLTTFNLKRDLMIGLNYKNINDKNIVIEKNKICKIIGLNLSTNSYSWDFQVFNFKG